MVDGQHVGEHAQPQLRLVRLARHAHALALEPGLEVVADERAVVLPLGLRHGDHFHDDRAPDEVVGVELVYGA